LVIEIKGLKRNPKTGPSKQGTSVYLAVERQGSKILGHAHRAAIIVQRGVGLYPFLLGDEISKSGAFSRRKELAEGGGEDRGEVKK